MASKLLFFAAKSQKPPSGWGLCPQAPFVIHLSCIGLFSSRPELDNFCANKFTFDSRHSLLLKSCLRFWSNSQLQTDFSSNCMRRIRNELMNATRLLRLFFQTWIQGFWNSPVLCSRKYQLLCVKFSRLVPPHFRLGPPHFVCSGDGTGNSPREMKPVRIFSTQPDR